MPGRFESSANSGPDPFQGQVLCPDNADWDWWLKQTPEFRGQAVAAIRMLDDARKMASLPPEPEFFNEVELGSTGASHGR